MNIVLAAIMLAGPNVYHAMLYGKLSPLLMILAAATLAAYLWLLRAYRHAYQPAPTRPEVTPTAASGHSEPAS